jgi:D-aminoacyl-tRNA deacylase
MRAVVQRVTRARVTVGDNVAGEIGLGLLVLLGVGHEDREADADYLADKIAGLRVFEDGLGKMNQAVGEVEGSVLVVSQFTLYGDVRRGKRPSFDAALRRKKRAPFTNILWSASGPRACAAKPADFRK